MDMSVLEALVQRLIGVTYEDYGEDVLQPAGRSVHPLVLAAFGYLADQPLDAVRGVWYPHPLRGLLGEGESGP